MTEENPRDTDLGARLGAGLGVWLDRIAAALERLSPPAPAAVDFTAAEAFVWHAEPGSFQPVANVNRVPLALLKGIDRTAATLLDNTRRFAKGLPANNALLWGARGMGKSSLVKAVHGSLVGASDSPSSSRLEAPGRMARCKKKKARPYDLAFKLPSCLARGKLVVCPQILYAQSLSMNGVGSTGFDPWRSSKCTCG